MTSNNPKENKPTELNQEYMMEMMSLPNAGKRKTMPVEEKENIGKTTNEPMSDNEAEAEPAIEKVEITEKKEIKRKKSLVVQEEYEIVFIKPGKLNVRNGKAIYIRPEFHKRIARIVQTVGEGKVSLTDYVDNVFAHHFQHFEQAIKESFNKNNEPIF